MCFVNIKKQEPYFDVTYQIINYFFIIQRFSSANCVSNHGKAIATMQDLPNGD